jgi:hypothetical protein
MKHKNIIHFLLLFFCILNLKFVKGQDSVLLPDRNFHRKQNKFEYIIAPFIIIRNGDTINNVKYNWINFENLDDCKEINQIVYFNRRLYFHWCLLKNVNLI